MAIDTMPRTMAFFFSPHNSAIRMVVVTSTPPIPNPEMNRHTLINSHEELKAVSNANKPKHPVDKATERVLPILSQIIPHIIPPNIHQKMNTQ